MKNLNEYKAEVFLRIEKGVKDLKRKRRVLTLCISACVCVVVAAAFFALQDRLPLSSQTVTEYSTITEYSTPPDTSSTPTGNSSTPANPPTTKDEHIIVSPAGDSSGDSTTTAPDNNVLIDGDDQKFESDNFVLKANKIVGQAEGARLYYDPELYSEKTLTDKEATDYLGLNYGKISLDADYRGAVIKNIITDQSGKTVYDTFTHCFGDDITILTSKIGLPYDCIYQLESTETSIFYSNDKTSQTTATIGTDNNGFYYADFAAGGTNYRITAKNCNSIQKFGTIIKAVIDLSAS